MVRERNHVRFVHCSNLATTYKKLLSQCCPPFRTEIEVLTVGRVEMGSYGSNHFYFLIKNVIGIFFMVKYLSISYPGVSDAIPL